MPRSYPSARGRILDAAERIILRDGPNGLSVDEVLREAHLSKGGFFHHFASKEALLAAITERLSSVVGAQIERAAGTDGLTHGASLRAHIALAFDMPAVERKRTQTLVLALVGAAMESPTVAKSARMATEETLARAAAEGVDVGVALVVQLALDGFFLGESLRTIKLDGARKTAMRNALLALVDSAARKKGGSRRAR